MSATEVRMVLAAMEATDGPGNGLDVDAVASGAACSMTQTRAALTTMLGLEPAWIDGDVVPDRGLVWWLTSAGRDAVDTARRTRALATAGRWLRLA